MPYTFSGIGNKNEIYTKNSADQLRFVELDTLNYSVLFPQLLMRRKFDITYPDGQELGYFRPELPDAWPRETWTDRNPPRTNAKLDDRHKQKATRL
jgi:hypothetical protein